MSNLSRGFRQVLLWSALAACSRGAAPVQPLPPVDAQALVVPNKWPALPRAVKDLDAVVRERANRPVAPRIAPSFEDVRAALGADDVAAGEDLIARSLDGWLTADTQPAYVLFGGTHDAPAHLDAFRRITTRMPHLWAVALETFRTSGAWEGTPNAESDDADLAAYFATGDTDALSRLTARQAESDYAAWKFGYVPSVLDVVVAARGARQPVFGCDMPASLRDVALEGEDALTQLRELHCALSVREQLRHLGPAHLAPGALYDDDVPPPPRAAFFLGANHAGPGGVGRFLQEAARLRPVYVLGGRPDAALPPGVTVVDSLLVPLRDGSAALLLPTPDAAALLDRARDAHGTQQPPKHDAALPASTVFFSSPTPMRAAVAGSKVTVGAAGEWVPVRGGIHACALERDGKTYAFALEVPATGHVEVRLDDAPVSLRILVVP